MSVENSAGTGSARTVSSPDPGSEPDTVSDAETASPPDTAPSADTASSPQAGGLPDAAPSPDTTGESGAAAVGAPAAEPDWEHFSPPADAPVRSAGRLRRGTRRVGRFLRHEWTLASLAGLALSMIMFWPAVLHPSTTITADIWDPTLQAWQMAWSGHILKTDPSQLWNSNSFYPEQYTFAFSDTLLGYFPAGLIGSGPVAAVVRYNIIFVLLQALAFVGAYALVRQLGSGRLGAAVAAVAFGYAPWRWSQAGHMHVMSVGGMLLAFAMLARGHGFSLRDGWRPERAKPGWAYFGWLVAAWQISLGFGIGIPFAYVLGIIGLVAVVTWLRRGRPRLGKRLVLFDGLGIVIFGAVAAFMARPYFIVVDQHPYAERSVSDLNALSPSIRSFFTAPAQSWLWGGLHEAARAAMPAPAETTLLPGFALYGLAFAGLFFSVWKLRTRVWLAAGVAVTMWLAWGTHAPFGKYVGYVLLYKYAPGWNAIRTPGRVIIWTTLLLGLLAAGAVCALVQRARQLADETTAGRPRLAIRLALLIPLLLVAVEGINALDHPDVPKQPAAMRTVSGPMLVLPSDQNTDEIVMLWSTSKFQPIVNGGSGFPPDQQAALRHAALSFPDGSSVAALRSVGVKSVVVLRHPPQTLLPNLYQKAQNPNVPIDGLGITRAVDDETIIYQLN